MTALAIAISSGAIVQATTPGSAPTVSVLSSRPDLVTGGDAIVEVRTAEPTERLVADLNGRDVSKALQRRRPGGYQAHVTGLAVGRNDLTVRAATGGGAPAWCSRTTRHRGRCSRADLGMS